MYKNKITQALLLGAGLAVAASSTLSIAAEVPAGTELAKVQELVRGNGTEVATIDPHKSQGVPESHVIRDLLEGLVNQDGEGNTIPGVAESWETTDNKTFTFHLRKDAKWSNGDPVTAQDFVYSWQRAVDPATASPYAWYMEYTKMANAKDIVAGKKDKSELGVKAVDANTLVVELETAVPYFVMMMGHTTMKPVHQATVEKYGDQWTKPENFVGNGAFSVDKWVVNERLVLKRNDQYWNNDKTVLNKVTFLPIENQVAEMNRFLSGEIDFTNELPTEHFKRLQKEYAEDVSVAGNLCTYYYIFNTKRAPFDDVRVRQAISYAIDRDIVTGAILAQGQKPAYFLTPEITAGFDPELPAYGKMSQKERNAEAERLLEEAGYGKDNPLKFNLLYNTSENHKKIAVALGSMWKKTLGLSVTLENQEWKTYLSSKDSGDFEVARAGWCGDYNEASSFLTLMKSNNTTGGVHYDSAAYDKIIDKALNSTSEEERKALYLEAEALMAKDMPIAPIYQYVKSRLLNPHVGGFPINNAEDKIFSKDLYIKAQ
ncbi:oligopeptide ABC transporter substrate-binding protein OppA [Vibrio crassostreae]|uniref:ABC transporter substrate-binding protein n=1 Tax=Vibrio crassostreae TaxID=246167 RepID=UPI000F487CB3|nr:ABC transporter substrate-binding protein [Vibrio crassostreae]NOH74032.1 oligopeptide ABC transporter substrate-binding protein OppA [Vibrio crassostreae]NOI51651.1 oligopeptide ABC transporter substrate-binding protein OppA [Vibrio crassostreae]ROR16846.1 oligopeptide transport system substrate-binding protein [Vibrio crassostreae]CAK2056986.1 oligopeptide ABC transporter periplasmic binding protein [Vibrio crassostreae]CAK2334323.1 oligopeptide ABC transporter periplasmic binding protein